MIYSDSLAWYGLIEALDKPFKQLLTGLQAVLDPARFRAMR